MNKTLITIVAISALVGVGYVIYSSTKKNTGGFGNKGTKQPGSFDQQGNGINVPVGGGKSGINVNIDPTPIINGAGNFLSGIFHPTNAHGKTTVTSSSSSTTS